MSLILAIGHYQSQFLSNMLSGVLEMFVFTYCLVLLLVTITMALVNVCYFKKEPLCAVWLHFVFLFV